MILVCLIFFHVNLIFASADEDQMNRLLIELKNKKTEIIPQIEELYNNSKDPKVSLIASFVLASAPAEKLKMHPAFYAQYHLMQNKNVDKNDRIMLSRIAGDGFFEKGQFDLALQWYQYGQKTPDLEPDQMEYFTYKVAWSQLNQNKANLAYKTLNDWLASDRPSLLREPMIVDAGRAYAEAQFSKKGPSKDKLKVRSWNEQESQYFLKGYLAGFRRSKQDLSFLVGDMEKLPFPGLGLQTLLQSSFFERKPACTVMPLINSHNFQYWKSSLLKTRLVQCLQTLVKAKQKNSAAYLAVSEKLATFSNLDYQETLLLAEGLKGARQNKTSCHRLVQASKTDELLKAKPKSKVWQDWLVRASEVCIGDGTNKMFADRILELSKLWYENNLEAYLLSQSEFPDSYKSRLIDQWLAQYGWTSQNLKNLDYVSPDLWLENRFESYSAAVLSSQNEEAILGFLTIVDQKKQWEALLDDATPIWPYLKKKPQYQSQLLASLLDRTLKVEGASPDFKRWPDPEMRAPIRALWDGQGEPLGTLQKLPIGLEFQHWQQSHEFLGNLQVAGNTKEKLINSIQKFLKLARNLQSIQWSSQALLLKSKGALLTVMESLKASITKAAAEDRGNQEWNLIGKELEKWAVKLR